MSSGNLRQGTRFGKWTLNEKLGQGGNGAVWLAVSETKQHAAIKFLTSNFLQSSRDPVEQEFRQRRTQRLGRQVPEYLIGNDRGWLKRAAMAACLLIALVVAGAIAIGPMDRGRILLGKPDGMEIAKVPSVPKQTKTESIRSGDEVAEPKDRRSAAPISEFSSAPPMPSADNSKGAELSLGDKSGVKNESVPNPSIEPSSIPSRKPNRMQWLPDSKPSSDSIVLAKVNNAADGTSNWKRLMAGEDVQAGERVVVPPAQRTEIRIEPGIRWLCAGESDLELLPSSTDSARVRLKAGRALLFRIARQIRPGQI